MAAEERFEETFVVGTGAHIDVSNVRGSIRIDSVAGATVQVIAVKRLESCKHPELTVIEIYQEGDRVVARVRPTENKGWRKQVCTVDYTVHVPAQCELKLSQVQGTIHVGGVTGRVDVNAVQGDVELYEIDGRTQVKGVNASVDGRGWKGRAQIDTVSGQIQVTQSQLSQVKANTVSGDVSLETALDKQGEYRFSSVSGDVTVYIPVQHGVETRGTTISGHLVCDLPHEYSRHSRAGWQATINGGGPLVRFSSISGDLQMLAAGVGRS